MLSLTSAPEPLRLLSSRSLLLLGLLLAADLVFISLDLAYQLGWSQDPSLSLSLDGGYAELFQYAKELWVGACLGGLAAKSRQPVYAVLAAFFFYLLLDDALGWHERAGVWVAETLRLGPFFSLRAQDIGETLFLGGVGAAALVSGLVSYRRSDLRSREVARRLAGAVGVLAIFGVGVDLLHQAFREVDILGYVLMVAEDGGELLVMSGIAAGVFALVYRTKVYRTDATGEPLTSRAFDV